MVAKSKTEVELDLKSNSENYVICLATKSYMIQNGNARMSLHTIPPRSVVESLSGNIPRQYAPRTLVCYNKHVRNTNRNC